ncbi:MAG: rhodanese-like domain-containing protein [Acidobacteriota bacterium]
MRTASLGLGILMPLLLCLGAGKPGDSAEPAATYRRLCMQCHGEDGDGLYYANIVPLAGISRRYPAVKIGQLSGAFSGRLLHGPELDRMVAYMGSLRGEKGFADPGWLATPYFVRMKSPRRTEVRVLDVRPPMEFESGHVPNALRVEQGAFVEDPSKTRQWMDGAGIGQETLVLVVDEEGTSAAACLWWKLRRAGHAYVAVMDGGMRRYRDDSSAGFPISAKLQAEMASRGFKPGSQISWTGSEPDLARVMLSLALLGQEAAYDPQGKTVSVGAPVR